MPRAVDSDGAVGPYITHEIWVPRHTAIHRRRPMDKAHMEQQSRPRAPSTKSSERFLGDSKLETEGKAERRKVRSGAGSAA